MQNRTKQQEAFKELEKIEKELHDMESGMDESIRDILDSLPRTAKKANNWYKTNYLSS